MQTKMQVKTIVAGVVCLGMLIACLAFVPMTRGQAVSRTSVRTSMRDYILAATRLVGSEVLEYDQPLIIKTSRARGDIVVSFSRWLPDEPVEEDEEATTLVATVRFTPTDVRVEPRALVLKRGTENRDYTLLRVATTALSKTWVTTGFDICVSKPETTPDGQTYKILVWAVPSSPGNFVFGQVIEKDGILRYQQSTAWSR